MFQVVMEIQIKSQLVIIISLTDKNLENIHIASINAHSRNII